MKKFTITVERTVTAENQADAISRFLDRPFGFGATTNIVEVAEPEPAASAAAVSEGADQAPSCRDHKVAMQQKPSKYRSGEFYWSCPAKNADGSYCRYRPK